MVRVHDLEKNLKLCRVFSNALTLRPELIPQVCMNHGKQQQKKIHPIWIWYPSEIRVSLACNYKTNPSASADMKEALAPAKVWTDKRLFLFLLNNACYVQKITCISSPCWLRVVLLCYVWLSSVFIAYIAVPTILVCDMVIPSLSYTNLYITIVSYISPTFSLRIPLCASLLLFSYVLFGWRENVG